jgi:aerobic C4-dicarboxylate transport protein
MSEARAVTNFSGNAVATVLIGAWTKSLDHRQMHQVLDGAKPFDERTMVDEEEQEEAGGPGGREPAAAGH